MGFRNLLSQLKYFEGIHDGEKEWFPKVIMRVGMGESLKSIAEELNCYPQVLREFIHNDDDREAAYLEALERKREMAGEELFDSTLAASRATVHDAQTSSGEWLEMGLWPKGLLAAADTMEFGADGRLYKLKADVSKSKDRLARMLGLDKNEQNVNLSVSLVSVLSGMPAGAIRQRPGAQAVEDATYSEPKQVAQKETVAGEAADTATPAGTLLLDNPPRQAVQQSSGFFI